MSRLMAGCLPWRPVPIGACAHIGRRKEGVVLRRVTQGDSLSLWYLTASANAGYISDNDDFS